MGIERSAGAVVFHRDETDTPRFLLLQYGPGHWDFPRGNMEEGESERDTAVREVREETGLRDLRFVPDFRKEVTWYYRRGGRTIRKTASYLLAESPYDEVTLSWEHKEFAWLPYEEARERVTFDNAKRILADVHAVLGGGAPAEEAPRGGRQTSFL